MYTKFKGKETIYQDLLFCYYKAKVLHNSNTNSVCCASILTRMNESWSTFVLRLIYVCFIIITRKQKGNVMLHIYVILVFMLHMNATVMVVYVCMMEVVMKFNF